MNNIIKIISLLTLLIGLVTVMVIKNISHQKQRYVNSLELELRKEASLNDLLKIEWEYLVSPINLKDITKKINSSEYNKYFIVLDRDQFKKDLKLGDYKDIINIAKPDKTLNISR